MADVVMKINFLGLWTSMLCNMDNREDKVDGKWKIYIHTDSIGTFQKVIKGPWPGSSVG